MLTATAQLTIDQLVDLQTWCDAGMDMLGQYRADAITNGFDTITEAVDVLDAIDREMVWLDGLGGAAFDAEMARTPRRDWGDLDIEVLDEDDDDEPF